MPKKSNWVTGLTGYGLPRHQVSAGYWSGTLFLELDERLDGKVGYLIPNHTSDGYFSKD